MVIPDSYCDIALAVQTGVELPPQVTAIAWRKIAEHKQGLLLMGRLPWLGCGDEIEKWANTIDYQQIAYLRLSEERFHRMKQHQRGWWNDPFGLRRGYSDAWQLARWFGGKEETVGSRTCDIALAIKKSVVLPTELRVRDWTQKEEHETGFLFLNRTTGWDQELQNWLDRRTDTRIEYVDGRDQPPEDSYRYLRIGPFTSFNGIPAPSGCTFGLWKDSFGLWKCTDDFSSISSWFGKPKESALHLPQSA